MIPKRKNYLNNVDMTKEIHKSKMSYTYLADPKYYNFDIVVYDIEVFADQDVCDYHYGNWEVVHEYKGETQTTECEGLFAFHQNVRVDEVIISETLLDSVPVEDFVNHVKAKKLEKVRKKIFDPKASVQHKKRQNVTLNDVLMSDIVIKCITYEHVPEDLDWNPDKVKRKLWHGHVKVPFSPFKYYIIQNGVPVEVAKSFYKNGEFDVECGNITDELAKMIMLLVDRIGRKGNFNGYTYLDEMKGDAMLHAVEVALKFEEGRQEISNPFAFYTTVITNRFKRTLNIEKGHQNKRDDMLEMAGSAPSYTRIAETEWNYRLEENNIDK